MKIYLAVRAIFDKFLSMKIELNGKAEVKEVMDIVEILSDCCGAPPHPMCEVTDGIGLCSACKEWTGFVPYDYNGVIVEDVEFEII